MTTDNNNTGGAREASGDGADLITLDFYTFSGLGELPLPSINQIYLSSNWASYPEPLRNFFAKTLQYYSLRKKHEGGVDHMQVIAPSHIDLSILIPQNTQPQQSTTIETAAPVEKSSPPTTKIEEITIDDDDVIIIEDDDTSMEAAHDSDTASSSGGGSPSHSSVLPSEEKEPPSTSTILEENIIEEKEEREEASTLPQPGNESPNYSPDSEDERIQAPTGEPHQTHQSSSKASSGHESSSTATGATNDAIEQPLIDYASLPPLPPLIMGGCSPNYSPSHYEETEDEPVTSMTVEEAEETNVVLEYGGESPNYSPSYHDQNDDDTTTPATSAGEEARERPSSSVSLIIDEGPSSSTANDKTEYDPWALDQAEREWRASAAQRRSTDRPSPDCPPVAPIPCGRPAPLTANVTEQSTEMARHWKQRKLEQQTRPRHLPPQDHPIHPQQGGQPAAAAPFTSPVAASRVPPKRQTAISSRGRGSIYSRRDPRIARNAPVANQDQVASSSVDSDSSSPMEIEDDVQPPRTSLAAAALLSDADDVVNDEGRPVKTSIDGLLSWAQKGDQQQSRKRRAVSPAPLSPSPPQQPAEMPSPSTVAPHPLVPLSAPPQAEVQKMLNEAKKRARERAQLASVESNQGSSTAVASSPPILPALSKEEIQKKQEQVRLAKMNLEQVLLEMRLKQANGNQSSTPSVLNSDPPPLKSPQQQQIPTLPSQKLPDRTAHGLPFPPQLQMPPQVQYNAPGAYSHPAPTNYQMKYRPSNWPAYVPPNSIGESSQQIQVVCAFCAGSHASENCDQYRTCASRHNRQKQLRLCLSCLGKYNKQECSNIEHRRLCPRCGHHKTNLAFCRLMCEE